jgi:hypothetical protein
VRAEIGSAVDRTSSPVPGDPTGGNHEEGGQFGLDASGTQVAIPAAPGAPNTSGHGVLQIDPFKPADPTNKNVVQQYQGNYHVHPAGKNDQGGLQWVQTPSVGANKDTGAASQLSPSTTNIVVGAGNGTVYFYGGNGIKATIPLKKFEKIP